MPLIEETGLPDYDAMRNTDGYDIISENSFPAPTKQRAARAKGRSLFTTSKADTIICSFPTAGSARWTDTTFANTAAKTPTVPI